MPIRCKEMLVAAQCKGLPLGVQTCSCTLQTLSNVLQSHKKDQYTDGVFICVSCMVENGAHFGHGLNGDNALDGQVGLIIDSQAIRGRPVASTSSVMYQCGRELTY